MTLLKSFHYLASWKAIDFFLRASQYNFLQAETWILYESFPYVHFRLCIQHLPKQFSPNFGCNIKLIKPID